MSRNNIGKTFEAVKSFGKKLVEKDSVGRIVIQPPRALLDDPSNAIVFKNYLALLHAVKGFMQRGRYGTQNGFIRFVPIETVVIDD